MTQRRRRPLGRVPTFLGVAGVGAGLYHGRQDVAEELAAGGERQLLAGRQDGAVGGSGGHAAHLAEEGNSLFEGEAFGLGGVLDGEGRHPYLRG
jgi:hypothetical protein